MYCDHIDGSTTFIAQLSVMVINREIHSSSMKFLIDEDRYFFTKVSPVYRIDACLIALTVMSYMLSRRTDILLMMESMLEINAQFFMDENLDGLIRVRLALFLGYYCDNLFKS